MLEEQKSGCKWVSIVFILDVEVELPLLVAHNRHQNKLSQNRQECPKKTIFYALLSFLLRSLGDIGGEGTANMTVFGKGLATKTLKTAVPQNAECAYMAGTDSR